MNRAEITTDSINKAIRDLTDKINYRLDQKGHGTFASRHEILGVLKEEFEELSDAVTAKDGMLSVKEELLDIAVGAVFAIACIEQGTLDW